MSDCEATPAATSPAPKPPQPGQVPPDFALPDTLGGVTCLSDFRQRRPVVLAFVAAPNAPNTRDWLTTLACCRARLDELGVAVVVAPEPLANLRTLATELDLPFRLLADVDGTVTARYAVSGIALALFALNRYGYLLQWWRATDPDALPPIDAAVDRIAFAEMGDCGCGLPAWGDDLLAPEQG